MAKLSIIFIRESLAKKVILKNLRSQKREAVRLITDRDITGFAPVHYAAKNGNLQVKLLKLNT